jgi:hypothetical protein
MSPQLFNIHIGMDNIPRQFFNTELRGRFQVELQLVLSW